MRAIPLCVPRLCSLVHTHHLIQADQDLDHQPVDLISAVSVYDAQEAYHTDPTQQLIAQELCHTSPSPNIRNFSNYLMVMGWLDWDWLGWFGLVFVGGTKLNSSFFNSLSFLGGGFVALISRVAFFLLIVLSYLVR